MSPSVLIREARKQAGLTQVELAERAGVTQSVVARLEQATANPTFVTMERLLHAADHRLELHAQHEPLATVDESQIVERLRLTPAERLATFTTSRDSIRSLRARVRRPS